ncbi:MAG: hypothetical protein GY935_17565 [Gammaproteobacteria bacterium]|nr:hypothetical protein [Gammaproteobacteria bacterium]
MGNSTASIIRYSNLNLLLILIFLAVTGCATTFKPYNLTCSYTGTSPAISGARASTKYVSIDHPPNWCNAGNDPAFGLAFSSSKLLGKFIEEPPIREDATHTFAILVRHFKVKDVDISTVGAIKDFFQKYYEIPGRWLQIGGEYYIELSPDPDAERYKITELSIEEDDSLNAECVRVKVRFDERGRKNFPADWILTSSEEHYICKSPYSKRVLIWAGFSERRRQGIEDYSLANKMKKEAELVLKSIEFLDPD